MKTSLVVIGLVSILTLATSACAGGGDGAEAPAVFTIENADEIASGTSDTPLPPDSGDFSEAAVQYLLELLEKDAAKYGWVAGCLWPEGTADNDTLYPAKLVGLVDTRAASGTWGFTLSADHAATVYQPDYSGPAITEFERVEGPSYLCYRPS